MLVASGLTVEESGGEEVRRRVEKKYHHSRRGLQIRIILSYNIVFVFNL